MFVVTVEFNVKPAHVAEFREQMDQQARNSVDQEADCHVFDVCVDEENLGRIFLYEKYTNREAFDAHLAAEHFQTFSQVVEPWVVSKNVDTWVQAES